MKLINNINKEITNIGNLLRLKPIKIKEINPRESCAKMNDEKNAVKNIFLLISFLLGNKIIREEIKSIRYENIIKNSNYIFFNLFSLIKLINIFSNFLINKVLENSFLANNLPFKPIFFNFCLSKFIIL